MHTERRCLQCGCLFRYHPSKDVRRNNRKYCSLACRKAKPYKALEKGVEPDTVLRMLNSGLSHQVIVDRLQITKQTLYRWMRHWGIEKETRYVVREW